MLFVLRLVQQNKIKNWTILLNLRFMLLFFPHIFGLGHDSFSPYYNILYLKLWNLFLAINSLARAKQIARNFIRDTESKKDISIIVFVI